MSTVTDSTLQAANSLPSGTTDAAKVSSAAAMTLDRLPNEVLLQVWVNLDDPAAFSQTCKRFQTVSKDTLWRARWLLTKYERYLVLFEAIARPKIFTSTLFEQLMRLAVPLSRNLGQLLSLAQDKDVRQAGRFDAKADSWGSGISQESLAAVLARAEELYGPLARPSSADSLDSRVFSDWLSSQENAVGEHVPAPSVQVQSLFTNFNFMPLPIEASSSVWPMALRRTRRDVSDALQLDISLLPATIANGCEMHSTLTDQTVEKILKINWNDDGWREPLKKLKVDGVLQVSANLVNTALSTMRNSVRHTCIYDALLHLDQESALPFKLQAVVEAELLAAQEGGISPSSIALLERLDCDFPDLGYMRPLFVRAMFCKAERMPTDDLNLVHSMMGRHKVTAEDVKQACLRVECRTAMPIKYALKFVEGFDLETFTVDLLESLLHQPFRGIMLRELDRFFAEAQNNIDFLSLLASAVEKQAFSHTQIPSQQWLHGSEDDPSELSCLEGEFFRRSTIPPIRSMLGFNFQRQNAESVNLCSCKSLWNPCTPPRTLALCPHQEQRLHDETKSPWLEGFTHFGGRRHDPPSTEIRRLQAFTDPNNVYGRLLDDNEHIAEACVSLLGPRSYAANILLAHALVNGNAPQVMSLLLDYGVPLTLEHLTIAMKVGHALPKAILHYIWQGAPVSPCFGAAHEKLLSSAQPSLTEEELQVCQDLSQPTPSQINISIDGSGTLQIEKSSAERTGPVDLLQHVPRPPEVTQMQFDSANVSSLALRIANVEEWLTHMLALKAHEIRKSEALKACWSNCSTRNVFSPAAESLSEFIDNLQVLPQRLRSDPNLPDAAVLEELASLWQDMRESDGEAFESEVAERVDGALHGFKLARSQRRAAFKHSPHSYKAASFRRGFAHMINAGFTRLREIHMPQMSDLPDEDPEDQDFTAPLAQSESEMDESDSGDELEISEDESDSDANDSPRKRLKVD